MTQRFHLRVRQEGAVLLTTVVLLVLFTLIAIAIFKGSLTSVRTIGNMQTRAEAIAASNDTIDRLLSNLDFTDPTKHEALVSTMYSYDANGDDIPEFNVTFPPVTQAGVTRAGPRCSRIEPLSSAVLNPNNPEDVNCMGSDVMAQAGYGITTDSGGTSIISQGMSLCANTEWSIAVRASDPITNTVVDVVQGVGVRVLTASVDSCD